MSSDCYSKLHSNKTCGDLDKNNMYLEKFSLTKFQKSDYETGVKSTSTIEKKLISNVYENLQSLNNITFKRDFSKVFHAGGLGELMVCSLLKLELLSGTTTRGADAVLLSQSEISENLQEGRYQIKYRDDRTSDVEFRIDVNSSDQLLPEYAWDYLLIATHTTRDKNYNKGVFSIKPNNFYMIPFEYAIKLSEDLNNGKPSKSANEKNYYFKFRINWNFSRKGNGNVGSKKECIEKYFRLNIPKDLEFNDVSLIRRLEKLYSSKVVHL
ncbi:MAG: hypothetical protein M1113_02480 [Candidatus Thermoplasmatota archaeon]|nr:hypothetical protein [Candidatus Thermoplasmatota archaeon]